MNIKKANPNNYYFECAWHNSMIHGTAKRNMEFETEIAHYFDGYQVIESGAQNGFSFAYVMIELPGGIDVHPTIEILIATCHLLASSMETSVELLSIHRWCKVL